MSKQTNEQDYRALDLEGRRAVLARFRTTQALTRAGVAANAGLHVHGGRQAAQHAEEAFAKQTHWGMGCTRFPISVDEFDAFCERERMHRHHGDGQTRRGHRTLARGVLEEKSLIVRPTGKRLAAPKRKDCWHSHPGFCRTRDEEVGRLQEAIFQVLKRDENQQNAGDLLLRFKVTCEHEEQHPGKTLFAFFASFRDRPRYRASYILSFLEGNDGEDQGPAAFPFVVVLGQQNSPMIPCVLQHDRSSVVSDAMGISDSEARARRMSWAVKLVLSGVRAILIRVGHLLSS